jgi:two-component system response regulator YesN
MRVILVQAAGWGEGHLADLLNGAADNMLSELLPSLSLVKGERITLVERVNSANEGTGELERAIRRVGQTLKCTVFAAAGCIVARPQELYRSFREAESIYSYRLLLGESGVYAIGDIASRSGGRTVCSQEEEKELSGILVSNNPAQLRQWVNRIVREQMDDGAVTPNSLQAYLQSVVFAGHRWLERAKGDGRASAPPATAYPFDTDPRPEAELFRILSSLMSAFHDTISDSRYTYMQRAIAYIRDRLDQHLTLQDVARFVHLTPNHFSEVFKKETGQSYIEFVTMERMRKAADVLSSTQMKIGEVAGAVGYEDIKYFSQQFKKYYGKTPSEFRQSPGS